jgi:hypothetical protein
MNALFTKFLKTYLNNFCFIEHEIKIPVYYYAFIYLFKD